MEIRPEPIREPRRIPMQLLVAAVLLALAAVAVGASLLSPGGLTSSPDLGNVAAGAASASPSASPDAKAKTSSGPSVNGWIPPGQLGKLWRGAAGGEKGGFLPGIKVTSISGTKVSLQSANGWQRTIDTTGVTITRAGSTIAVGDLRVGDRIAVGETRGSDGNYTVKTLTVVLDQVAGTIAKIDTGSITVSLAGKKTATVNTDAATVYRRAGQAISRADLVVGQRLVAAGATGTDGSLMAQAVDVQPDMVFGTVTKKSGNTLTISTVGGGTATVQVTSTTTYSVAGKSSATLADVAVKDTIVAQGVLGKDGALTATTIRAGTGKFLKPSTKAKGNPHAKASPSPSATSGTSG